MDKLKLDETQFPRDIYITSGRKATMPPGQSVVDVEVLECINCNISFQMPFTCKKILGTRTEKCVAVYCGRCYLDISARFKQCSNCHAPLTGDAASELQALDEGLLKHIWRKILVKCRENSCQRNDIPLVDYEEHMKVAHKVFTPPIIDDDDIFYDHMRVMNEVVDENRREESLPSTSSALPSTSRIQGGEQNLQFAPSWTTRDSLESIVEQLNHDSRCLLLLIFCEKHITDAYFLKNVSEVSEMLEVSISGGKTLNELQIALKNASEKECFESYDVFYNAFFSQSAGQGSGRSSDSLDSYMSKPLYEIIGDISDRRGRVKFLNFVSMCSIGDLEYINKELNLRVSFENYGVEEIDFLGAKIMFNILRNCMSLNDILRKIEQASPSKVIVKCLREKINIKRLPVTEDIKSKFKEILKHDRKEINMALRINNDLSSGQTFRLALLLMNGKMGSIGSGCKTFSDLFLSLLKRRATVEELVLALVDADLFGVVKEKITACYGNPVESTKKHFGSFSYDQRNEESVGQASPSKFASEILLDSNNRQTRIKLIRCLKKCEGKDLVGMAHYFNLSADQIILIKQVGYPEMMMCMRNVTFEKILRFFKLDEVSYSPMIHILEGETNIDVDLPVSVNLKARFKEIINQGMIMLAFKINNVLDDKAKKVLPLLLVKNSAGERSKLAKSSNFIGTFSKIMKRRATLEELVAALQDLELKNALAVVEEYFLATR